MTASNFDQSLKWILQSEGGWTDDPHDPGGATMWGIIQTEYDAYLRQHGLPHQSVRFIHPAERDEIYRKSYWDAMNCDALPAGLDYCVFDAAVNSGVSRAKAWLEESGSSISALCDMRLRFLKGLRTWRYFGGGWGTRMAFVRKNAEALASGQPVFDTAWVQAALNKLGENLSADGDDGPLTIAAVKRFQAGHGLDVDGAAGPLTCTAIQSALAAKEAKPIPLSAAAA
jgi:lysozyme family protein